MLHLDEPITDAGEDSEASAQISMHLPVAYVRIIASEARALGVRKRDFLTILVKRYFGELTLERSPKAPIYEATDEELSTKRLFALRIYERLKHEVEDGVLGMGNVGFAVFFMRLIDAWLGQPLGLKRNRVRASLRKGAPNG